jgi:ornithine cyclodeaminase/alanine dehydrogenase-like protein (mu-crystallin family)
MLERAHLRALSHRLHLPRVRVLDMLPQVAEAYAETLGSELGFPVELVRLGKWELAAHNADIVVTVTAGDQPAVERASLRSGAFVARLGS